ncbi:MAG: polyphosphate polymerase domain-containing protein [Porticoccaceae bacterium]|nr:polyphosphate polymerase domain-containing protein [Porticoccaceae bacterium]
MNQSPLQNVDNALREFTTHALADLDDLKLMDRVDSKFVVPAELLPFLLQESQRQYSLLSIDGVVRSDYLNVYFDTDGFDYYLMHHNGKLNRVKVRHRHYVDTGTAFLELKFKNNKGRTLKTRVQADLDADKAIVEHRDFLSDHGIAQQCNLRPCQISSYQRICLASQSIGERITIDTKPSFVASDSGAKVVLDDAIIIEIKQPRIDRQSPFYRLVRSLGLRPQSFSKYCVGVSLTMQDRIKTNRFQRDIRKVAKFSNSLRTITV